jgi:DNA-binding CsgD family transcriptional regulator
MGCRCRPSKRPRGVSNHGGMRCQTSSCTPGSVTAMLGGPSHRAVLMSPSEPAHVRDGRARSLLAELADCACDDGAGMEGQPLAGAEVLLDTVLDGVRYQLLRAVAVPEVVHLSSRELEIARMIATGHTNRTIAAVLDISPWTVSTHLRRVYAKLNVGSRAAMVARLSADGMLPRPSTGPGWLSH